MMIKLPLATKSNLQALGYQNWLDNLDNHLHLLRERFAIEPIETLEGGLAGLTLLTKTNNGQLAVLKTEPRSIEKFICSFSLLQDNPYTSRLLDYDRSLQAVLLDYIDGYQPKTDDVRLEDIAMLINSWKDIDASGHRALSHCIENRMVMTEKRLACLQGTELFKKVPSKKNKNKSLHKQLQISKADRMIREIQLSADFLIKQANDSNTFVHNDFGPANLLFERDKKQLMTIDCGGASGNPAYDIGSMGALLSRTKPDSVSDKVCFLAEATELDSMFALQAARFWALTTVISNLISGREQDAKALSEVAKNLAN